MIKLLRILFIIIACGISVINFLDASLKIMIIAGLITAGLSFLLIIFIEYISHAFSTRLLLSAILGLLVGLILSHLLVIGISLLPLPDFYTQTGFTKTLMYYVISFSIMIFFIIHNEELVILNKIIPEKISEDNEGDISYKILDTSTIIDGRIFDICDTGFLEGILVVPNFVINELQMVADFT